ncbi:UNVERIFIED_CONTAM: hypothetical protein Slati_2753400 [Sesamum latifolium]|uniref:Reverse transcriptase n=1 Tax=Sesamum latifolium TaxID=2727402 RepID=A0AAW2W0F1_9LAMI
MDVKMAFLNGFIEEEIFMDQPEGFTTVGEEKGLSSPKGPSTASSKLPKVGTRVLVKSYGVMISSRNDYDPCVYKKDQWELGCVPCALCR